MKPCLNQYLTDFNDYSKNIDQPCLTQNSVHNTNLLLFELFGLCEAYQSACSNKMSKAVVILSVRGVNVRVFSYAQWCLLLADPCTSLSLSIEIEFDGQECGFSFYLLLIVACSPMDIQQLGCQQLQAILISKLFPFRGISSHRI